MAEIKTKPTEASARSFIEAVENPTRREDARTVCAMMERITGHEALGRDRSMTVNTLSCSQRRDFISPSNARAFILEPHDYGRRRIQAMRPTAPMARIAAPSPSP